MSSDHDSTVEVAFGGPQGTSALHAGKPFADLRVDIKEYSKAIKSELGISSSGLKQRIIARNGSPPLSKPNGTGSPPQNSNVQKPSAVTQLLRFSLLNLYWWTCIFSIAITQYLGAPLYLINKRYYYAYMEFTKRTMALLVISLTEWWAPSTVTISGDASMRDQIKQLPDGRVQTDFASRLVLISNHHLYNDWMYLWWTAYANRTPQHGSIYIILKNQIKYVPIIGTGLRLAGFVFMSRNMATDGPRLKRRMGQLTRPGPGSVEATSQESSKNLNPMWLMMFPEGTNLGLNGRTKSAAWAKKQGCEDLKHALIPRSTGTYFCLKALGGTVEWVYDCTLAYDGIPPNQWGQEVFTLRSCYIEGRPPAGHMYWRRYHVSSIPLNTPEAFDGWLRERWNEKDELLEMHAKMGCFPAGESGQGHVITTVRLGSLREVASIFAVVVPFWGLVGWARGWAGGTAVW